MFLCEKNRPFRGETTWGANMLHYFRASIEYVGILTRAHSHLTLKLEGLFPMEQPLDDFQWPLEFHGHGFLICVWGPLRTRDREPLTLTLQALSLVEKAEPIQVRFTLHLRDQQSGWMQDDYKVYVDSYMPLNGSCFVVTQNIFKITSWR